MEKMGNSTNLFQDFDKYQTEDELDSQLKKKYRKVMRFNLYKNIK